MLRLARRAALMLVVLSTAAAAPAQTVDEIVAMNLDSKGGAAKWKTVDSVRMTGRMTAQGMELPMTLYARRPNHTRQEMVIKGATLVQAFDGTIGWVVNPLIGSEAPQELPAPLVEMMRNTADFDGPLVGYKAKGHEIEYVGTDKVGDADVHHLKVTMKGGGTQHYYLDASTGVELKKSQDVELGPGGQQTLETRMSDYRPVDGILVAHAITQLMDGKPVAEMSIESVEFNPAAVQDTLFRMPAR